MAELLSQRAPGGVAVKALVAPGVPSRPSAHPGTGTHRGGARVGGMGSPMPGGRRPPPWGLSPVTSPNGGASAGPHLSLWLTFCFSDSQMVP